MRALVLTMTTGLLALGPATPTAAQDMNLEAFVATANGIPRNPTALLRSDFRRVRREFEAGFRAVVREQNAPREAGRPKTICPPVEFEVGAEDTLRRLNAIPQARRRSMTITDGVREIMRQRFPCPAN